jgi:ECF sigma factor
VGIFLTISREEKTRIASIASVDLIAVVPSLGSKLAAFTLRRRGIQTPKKSPVGAVDRLIANHARNRNRLKRAGGRSRYDVDQLTGPDAAADLLELDGALDRLGNDYPAVADLVKLRTATPFIAIG